MCSLSMLKCFGENAQIDPVNMHIIRQALQASEIIDSI